MSEKNCGNCLFFDWLESLDTSFTKLKQKKAICTNDKSDDFGKWVLEIYGGKDRPDHKTSRLRQ